MKRNKPQDFIRGGMTIQDLVFNERAGAYKVIGPILGDVIIKGSLATAVQVMAGSLIAVFNNSAAVAFVKTGDATVTAPTDGSNGIPIKPYDYLIISMGENSYIISNTADVFGYLINDETTYR